VTHARDFASKPTLTGSVHSEAKAREPVSPQEEKARLAAEWPSGR
jgi:hypothetical protein